MTVKMPRRQFLATAAAAGGGLWFSLHLPGCATTPPSLSDAGAFVPNAWLNITADDRITVFVDRVEMGQGTTTSTLQLIAEELDVSIERIHAVPAGVAPAYDNGSLGMQMTGGSTSTASSWTSLRQAGAAARETLKRAAAKRWEVPIDSLAVDDGVVKHAQSGKSVRYGELVEEAGRLPRFELDDVELRPTKAHTKIGKPVARHDARIKVDGNSTYGIDVRLDGMLTAVVVRSPVFGGRVVSFADAETRKVRGVKHVLELENGIAVVADGYWQARKGADALKVEWDDGANAKLSSEAQRQQYAKMATHDAKPALDEIDVDKALSSSSPDKRIEAIYEAPYLAHAPMEPQNCTAHFKDGKLRIWAPTQVPDMARTLASVATGVDLENIEVTTTMIGGAFGRRLAQDYVVEAAALATKLTVPVKIVWSREDDIRHDYYRPSFYSALRGAVDDKGRIAVWDHNIASQSILTQALPEWMPDMLPSWLPRAAASMAGGALAGAFENALVADFVAVEGAYDMPYAIGKRRVSYAVAPPVLPVGFWRSVGHSENAFVVESFVDELAHAAGEDPYRFRRNQLISNEEAKRNVAVLDAVARASAWDKGPPDGRFRGIAQHKSFGSYAAEVLELSVDDNRQLTIHNVWIAIDCGRIINPDIVRQQLEGGVVFALSMALKQEITLDKGRVQQSNFHDFPTLRMSESPEIECILIDSDEDPTGVGEPGVPPTAPALANAIFAATGKRIRTLPIEDAMGA